MEEVVVHVKTLEQWESVLDTWFKQGYKWVDGDTGYFERGFSMGSYLTLDVTGEILQ